ncbi:hypothetical protein PMZ80_010897 [Knufia obscura]|nr:hypothetical protein PMZ80_010897 [Knufia obscura]
MGATAQPFQQVRGQELPTINLRIYHPSDNYYGARGSEEVQVQHGDKCRIDVLKYQKTDTDWAEVVSIGTLVPSNDTGVNAWISAKEDYDDNSIFIFEQRDDGFALKHVNSGLYLSRAGDWLSTYESDDPDDSTFTLNRTRFYQKHNNEWAQEYPHHGANYLYFVYFKSTGSRELTINDEGFLNLKDSGRYAMFRFDICP